MMDGAQLKMSPGAARNLLWAPRTFMPGRELQSTNLHEELMPSRDSGKGNRKRKQQPNMLDPRRPMVRDSMGCGEYG